jgi:predicted dehydrogenase
LLLTETSTAQARTAQTSLSVLVVGCGNIAGGFDTARDPRLPPLSHAGAFSRHGGFRLLACVEPNNERRQSFMKRWPVSSGFASLAEVLSAFEPGAFDVVSLCSPTSVHAEQLRATLALRPRLVFCEKPISPSLTETTELVHLCDEAGVPLAVNHTRRWAPDVQRLAEELQAGYWGAVRSAVGTYNKGVLNNGSHLVDLLHLLLGPLILDQAGVPVADFWPDDPTVPALLRTLEGTPVHLATAHAHDASIFELQLITERAVITMEDGGLTWRVRRVLDSPVFAGYRVLDAGEWRPGEYQLATSRAVSNLHDHLKQGMPLASDGHSALAAQRLCDAIRRAATAGEHTTPKP